MKNLFIKFAVGFVLSINLITLSGCFYSLDEMGIMNEYKKIAKENAIAYVEEKYGFTPDVLDAECEKAEVPWAYDQTPEPTGYVYVKLYDKTEETVFWVYATGMEESTTECYDNYQYTEIENFVYEQVETMLEVDAGHIDLAYGVNGDAGRIINAEGAADMEYGLVHDYFDGTNLSTVLGNAEYNKMVVCLAGNNYIPDVLDCTFEEVNEEGVQEGTLPDNHELIQLLGENIQCRFLNYNDEASYKIVHQDGCVCNVEDDYLGWHWGKSLEDWYLYTKDSCYITGEKGEQINIEYSRYEVKQFEDFYYVAMGGTYCNFTEADDELGDESVWDGKGMEDARKVFGAYRVDSDADRIYLFIPISALEVEESIAAKLEKESLGIAEQYMSEDAEKGWVYHYSIGKPVVTGDFTSPDAERYVTEVIFLHDNQENKIFSVFIEKADFE